MIGTKLYKPENPAEYAQLAIWCNSNNAYIKDMGDYYECFENEPPTEQENIINRVIELKQFLLDTDYEVIKCYDRGLIFREEFPELYAQRQEARNEINSLEN